jgi:hypothetical protein
MQYFKFVCRGISKYSTLGEMVSEKIPNLETNLSYCVDTRKRVQTAPVSLIFLTKPFFSFQQFLKYFQYILFLSNIFSLQHQTFKLVDLVLTVTLVKMLGPTKLPFS